MLLKSYILSIRRPLAIELEGYANCVAIYVQF